MGKVASCFGLRKCAKREKLTKDRISQLPDEILVSILSFLTIKEAARTSVISKRWRNLWTQIGFLYFDAPGQLEKIALFQYWTEEHEIVCKRERRKYVKWVNKVLQSHKAVTLDDFRIHFDLNKSSQGSIYKWLQYVFDRKVQSLELNLLEHGNYAQPSSESYTFPVGLLGLRSGRSLGALSLKRVNVSGEILEFFTFSCQFLERLVVHGSIDLIIFEVSDPCVALKHLEIRYYINIEWLTVCNVNLVSLKATQVSELVLKNVPILVDVNVCCRFSRVLRDVIPGLFCCLSKLEVLTLHVSSTEAIQLEVMFLELHQLATLKQLILEISASEGKSLLGLTSLIRAAPNLEKLVIELGFDIESNRRCRKLESFKLSAPTS